MDIIQAVTQFDHELFRAMNQAGGNIAIDSLMVAFTLLGMTYLLVLIVIPLWLQGRKFEAIDVILLLVISDVLSELLKLLFERPRPAETLANVRTLDWGFLASASGFSFPSGHALRAFAVGVYLVLSLDKRVYRLTAIGFAAMVGVSRIYLGLHWPSDIVAGALIGASLAAFVYLIRSGEGRFARVTRRFVHWLDERFNSLRTRRTRSQH